MIGIKDCHSEEANLELYCLVKNNRPTQNLSFPIAQSLFFNFKSDLMIGAGLGSEILGRRGFNQHVGKRSK
jgi:hypothetical protein